MSLAEVEKTIENFPPMLSISLTGGEPFLRDDLAEITRLIARDKLTNNITLPTNGFDTTRIIKTTEKILSACPNINISLGVSIDGYENEHDNFRNKKGSYNSAISTIVELKKLQKNYRNLKLGIGITLHTGNQDFILGLRNDIDRKFDIKPGITLIRGNAKLPNLKNVDADIYKKAIEAIENDRKISRSKSFLQTLIETREVLGQKLAYKTYSTQLRSHDCYAGSLMGIIYENGDVYPCEMLEEAKFGNLRNFDYDIKRIWNCEKAKETRKFINERKCFCTYECQYTCNTLYNIKFLPLFARNILRRTFAHV